MMHKTYSKSRKNLCTKQYWKKSPNSVAPPSGNSSSSGGSCQNPEIWEKGDELPGGSSTPLGNFWVEPKIYEKQRETDEISCIWTC